MTRAHGFAGDVEAAMRAATEAVQTARAAGDVWVTALAQIALGAGLTHAQRAKDALNPLGDALATFRACGDSFGRAAARLWLARAYWELDQSERMLAHLDEALALAQEQQYDYLIKIGRAHV